MAEQHKNKLLKQLFREKLGDELKDTLKRRAVEVESYEFYPDSQPPLECRILASKSKWKMMRACLEAIPNGDREPSSILGLKAFTYPNLPFFLHQRETAAKAWKRLISEAHEYALKASGKLRIHLSDSLISSRVAVSEVDAMYIQIQRILHDSSLLLDMKYDNLQKTCRDCFTSALSLSIDDARRKLYELYAERMILPVWDYCFMLYEVDCKTAEQKGKSLEEKRGIMEDPATLFSIGLRVREKADKALSWARKSKNYDEWFVNIFRCLPLYGEANLFLYNAAKEELDHDKREDYLREEYSANEMAVDCISAVLFYGTSAFHRASDFMEALGRGVADAKRTAFFYYSGRPLLPEFAYKAIDHFLSQNDTKSIRDSFMSEFNAIMVRNLDVDSVILANEAYKIMMEDWMR